MVPVVLKKSIYESILPAGSFIAADDFTSPRELAEYLQYLSNNDTAYLRYQFLNSAFFVANQMIIKQYPNTYNYSA